MDEKSKVKLHSFCCWAGIIFVLALSSALIFMAEYFPPPSPANSVEQLMAMFTENQTGIRLAMIIMMLSTVFYIMYTTVIAHYISILEGHNGVLTMLMSLGGTLNVVAFIMPSMWWITAVYRIDRNPEIIYMLNDMAWLAFMGVIAANVILMTAITIAAFIDKRPEPLFPRWFGYFNIWGITMFLAGQLIFFFQEGVFAWNGLIGFWLPAIDFFLQLLIALYFVWKAVNRAKLQLKAN